MGIGPQVQKLGSEADVGPSQSGHLGQERACPGHMGCPLLVWVSIGPWEEPSSPTFIHSLNYFCLFLQAADIHEMLCQGS